MQKRNREKNTLVSTNVLVIAIILFMLVFYIAMYAKKPAHMPLPQPATTNTLTVTTNPWSGWSPALNKDNSNKIDSLHPSSDKQTVMLQGISNDEKYKLEYNLNGDMLDLTVHGLSVKQGEDLEKDGINLKDCGIHSFKMNHREIVELNTCSMDAGVTYTIVFD